MALQGRPNVHNAKATTSIGRKRTEDMPEEAALVGILRDRRGREPGGFCIPPDTVYLPTGLWFICNLRTIWPGGYPPYDSSVVGR